MKSNFLIMLTLVLSSNHVFAANDGTHGINKVITANGPLHINLSGGDGGLGSTGDTGWSGRCDSGTDSNGNTYNNDSNGLDGARGGDGGNGGNGGNLTVLFRDINELRNILFISRGGRGGAGGDGGQGGIGCPNGGTGPSGSIGHTGASGRLYLVENSFFPYRPDSSNQHYNLSDLFNGRKVIKNIWKAFDARSVLEDGSDFGSGFMLEKYEYGSAQVILSDPSKIDPLLLESKFYVEMNQGVTKINADSGFLMVAEHSEDSSNAILQIKRLYSAYDFKSIAAKTVYTKNYSRYLHLTTNKDLVPRPILSMKLKIEVKGRFFMYHEVFNEEVPASMIETLKAGYSVDLDQLPIDFKIPRNAKIRLSMTYKLQELSLAFEKNEVLIVKLKDTGNADQ